MGMYNIVVNTQLLLVQHYIKMVKQIVYNIVLIV